ncbi:MAG TPA: type II toxin-antitoxin system HicB family antitoxin [Flavipsychrobacter sp.]|nr:type II toxin-antitoxin system HicB family antitoxin [Flavipsychrobacter sp.]
MDGLLNFKLELTGIIVPDEKTGQYSAFFAEFPEAIACGSSMEDAQQNLMTLFQVMLQDRKEDVIKNHMDHVNYITKPVNMVVA